MLPRNTLYLQVVVLLVWLTPQCWSRSMGTFIQQSAYFQGTPLTLRTDVPNGNYTFNVGWIEPLTEGRSKIFGETYLKPSGSVFFSPYTMYGSALFQWRFINWVEIGAGYHRYFYQKTLISWSGSPGLSEWRTARILKDIPSEGQFAGADVFLFTGLIDCKGSLASLELYGSSELWNVDSRGQSHVYEYTSNLLIESRDVIYRLIGTVALFPDKKWSPAVENRFLHSDKTNFTKNRTMIGLAEVPVGLSNVYLDMMGGFWTHHPQLEDGDTIAAFIMSVKLTWSLWLSK